MPPAIAHAVIGALTRMNIDLFQTADLSKSVLSEAINAQVSSFMAERGSIHTHCLSFSVSVRSSLVQVRFSSFTIALYC
jgi:hypothetical protein